MIGRLRQSSRGLSEEIRDRLERTLKEDATDPVTRELRNAVADIAELVRQDFGDWHTSRRAHAVFTAMLVLRLADYAPPKVAPSAAVSDLFSDAIEDSPEAIDAIARMRASDNRRTHSYPHLEAARKRKPSRIGATLQRMRERHAKKEGDDNE